MSLPVTFHWLWGAGERQREVDELNQQCGKNQLSPTLEALKSCYQFKKKKKREKINKGLKVSPDRN